MLAIGAFALLKQKRTALVDFAVPRTAAERALRAEPLYRPEDGHYQYKYLPAFALVMTPFTVPPTAVAEVIWFSLAVAMTWALVRLSLRALPDRRLAAPPLIWLTLLLNGKYLVKELAFGNFNLPLGLLLIGAVLAAQSRRWTTAGALVGIGVFVKPYALVFVPWLAWACGAGALVALTASVVLGLAAPAVLYGWSGNLTLLHEWYRTVTDTTAPNLLGFENISFMSMWARWVQPGPAASTLAAVTAVAAMAVGAWLLWQGRGAKRPDFLEAAYFLFLIPLLSPQGWDYVLLLALPGCMLIVDRFRELGWGWRTAAALGFVLTSFAIYDLYRRALYFQVMQMAGGSVGAILLALTVVRIRHRALA